MLPKASHFLLELHCTPGLLTSNAMLFPLTQTAFVFTTLPHIAKHCLNCNSSCQVGGTLLKKDRAKKREKERELIHWQLKAFLIFKNPVVSLPITCIKHLKLYLELNNADKSLINSFNYQKFCMNFYTVPGPGVREISQPHTLPALKEPAVQQGRPMWNKRTHAKL